MNKNDTLTPVNLSAYDSLPSGSLRGELTTDEFKARVDAPPRIVRASNMEALGPQYRIHDPADSFFFHEHGEEEFTPVWHDSMFGATDDDIQLLRSLWYADPGAMFVTGRDGHTKMVASGDLSRGGRKTHLLRRKTDGMFGTPRVGRLCRAESSLTSLFGTAGLKGRFRVVDPPSAGHDDVFCKSCLAKLDGTMETDSNTAPTVDWNAPPKHPFATSPSGDSDDELVEQYRADWSVADAFGQVEWRPGDTATAEPPTMFDWADEVPVCVRVRYVGNRYGEPAFTPEWRYSDTEPFVGLYGWTHEEGLRRHIIELYRGQTFEDKSVPSSKVREFIEELNG